MKKLMVVAGCVSLIGVAVAQGGLIVQYGFNNNADPSNVAPLIDEATVMDVGNPANLNSWSYSAIRMEGTHSAHSDNNKFYSTTDDVAYGLGRYWHFTLTPEAGYWIDYSEFSFHTLRVTANGTGAPDSFSIRTSQDNFASVVYNGADAISLTADTTWIKHSVDLSGVADLQNAARATEFRITFWVNDGDIAGAGERVFRVDDLRVEGDISVIPEPSSLLLMFAAIGCMILHRMANRT